MAPMQRDYPGWHSHSLAMTRGVTSSTIHDRVSSAQERAAARGKGYRLTSGCNSDFSRRVADSVPAPSTSSNPSGAVSLRGLELQPDVSHLGLTSKGAIGATTAVSLEDAPKLVQAMCDAAKEVNPNILVLCHGGPIAEPSDAAYVLAHTSGVVGFYGASSTERLPTEIAIRENAKRFKETSVNTTPQ
ncbi:MAG: phosphoenolpyruvate hydrolase family protein, partial [Thermomicrobiales bacterium]